MRVVILGAGIGGKLAAVGIKNKFPEYEVTLVGPESKEPSGLFYFNEKIPGIAEKEVKVSYDVSSVNEGGSIFCREDVFRNYQIKSRGTYSPSAKISSFDKVGTTETGYFMDDDFDLSDINWIKDTCDSIFTKKNNGFNSIITHKGKVCDYDKLISTIPFNILYSMIFRTDIVKSLKSTPVYVVEVTSSEYDYRDISKINVIYDVSEDKFYRHSLYYNKYGTYVKISSETIIDITDQDDWAALALPSKANKVVKKKLSPGKIIPDEIVVKNPKDLSDVEVTADTVEELTGIRILGRYARWDYHYLVTDTYKDAISFVSSD